MAVRHNNLESPLVVQERELAINRALYGLLWRITSNSLLLSIPKL